MGKISGYTKLRGSEIGRVTAERTAPIKAEMSVLAPGIDLRCPFHCFGIRGMRQSKVLSYPDIIILPVLQTCIFSLKKFAPIFGYEF